MKRVRIWLLVLMLCLTIILSVHSEKEKVVVTVWDYYFSQSKFYENEIKLFQEKYPWIEIKRTKQVGIRYQEIINLATRDQALPDLIAPYGGTVIDIIEQGMIRSMEKWVTPEWKKRFPKGVFMEGVHTIHGQTYLIPFTKPYVYHQLYINRKVFRDSGLVDKKGKVLHPKNWAEFRKFAKIITQKGKGKIWGLGMASMGDYGLHTAYFYEWARWAGGAGGDHVELFELDYRKGKYTFDNPAYVQLFLLLLGIKKDGSIIPNYLSMDDEVLRVMFADGKVGMIVGGLWNQVGWKTTHPGWSDYDCIPEPAPDDKGYRCMQCVSPEPTQACYMMSKYCKHPEEAWLFVDWLTTPEAGARLAKSGTNLSIYPEANKNPDNTEQFNQYVDICNKFLRWAPNPIGRNPELAYVKITNKPTPTRENLFWGILSGMVREKDIPRALYDMNNQYNAILEEALKAAQKEGHKVSMQDLIFPDWNPLENYGK